MPALTRKSKINPEEVYVATQAFAATEGTVKRGARLRGSTPVVKAHPEMFAVDSTPPSEWSSPWAGVVTAEEIAAHDAPPPPAPPIGPDTPASAIRVCTRQATWHGRTLEPGDLVTADDELYRAASEAFRPLL